MVKVAWIYRQHSIQMGETLRLNLKASRGRRLYGFYGNGNMRKWIDVLGGNYGTEDV